MPYISTERVKEVREVLKKKFPTVKFSVTREHYSTIRIAIMESNYRWSKDHQSLNHFYLENEENSKFLLQIKEIANAGNKIESVDGDYGNIPKFYLDMQVGKWDKPHKWKADPKNRSYASRATRGAFRN
jgi:hypothetical protein